MDLSKVSAVVGVHTESDDTTGIQRMQVSLDNGYEVSIITGGPLHGGREGVFETVPVRPGDDLLHDELKGYLSAVEVLDEIERVAALPSIWGGVEGLDSTKELP